MWIYGLTGLVVMAASAFDRDAYVGSALSWIDWSQTFDVSMVFGLCLRPAAPKAPFKLDLILAKTVLGY